MFTFIKSNGLCDVECRTTVPLTFKRVLNSDGVVGDWQQLVTTTEVAHVKRFYSVPGNDWNNAIEEGYYDIPFDVQANAIKNRPFDFALQMRVITSDTNDPNYVYQIAYVSSQDSRIFIRKLNGDGNWTPWEQLATMDKVNASLGELCNKKIYCGEVTGTIVNGAISTINPIGKVGNAIATIKYTGSPVGYSVTTQVTLSAINFYFRWHRESDGAEAYPPDGTEITMSYMIFY